MIQYKFETRISGKTIHCRAFTLEEYLQLIQAKSDGNIPSKIKELINNCTDATDLNRQESELLILKLWANSIGEVNHQASWVCECGNEIEVPINFTYAQIDSPEDLWYDLKNFKIKFKYPKIFDDSNIALMIAECIEYILVNNEQIYVEELNDQELNDLYSAITADDIVKIKEMLLKPKVSLSVPISCACGKSHIHTITGLKEFFKIMQ